MKKHRAALAPNRSLWREIVRNKYIYLILLPGLIYYIIFAYGPMYGLTIAFKSYNVRLGILGSPWNGVDNFVRIFRDAEFYTALKNTFIISFSRILVQFPVPIILALLLNELREGVYKKTLQTVLTFPNFLSWVVVSSILMNFLGNGGALNSMLEMLGMERQNFLANAQIFRPLLYVTEIWKSAGLGSIIYLAAISAISPDLYEAATIDGAGRFQKMISITWPSIRPTVVVMLILAVGGVMNAGFDQIFNMENPAVRPVSEILDTYIYRITFNTGTDFGFSTGVGLFKSVINFIMLFTFDKIARVIGGQSNGIFKEGVEHMVKLRRKRRVEISDIVIYSLLTLFGLIVFYPFYNSVLISLVTSKEYIQTPFMLFPKNPTLDSYLYLFEDRSILYGYRSTLFLVLVGVPYNLLLTSMVAYAMSRPAFPGKKFFNTLIIITMYFGGGIIPTYLLMRSLGLLNSLASVILVYGVNTYNMIIMRNFFQAIPASIEESAKIDGANDLVVLFKIVLPLSKPIIATMLLFFTVDRWNEWFNAMVFLRDNGKWPLQLVLRSIVNQPMVDFSITTSALKNAVFSDGIKMAAVVVTMLPVMLVYPFVQKYFMKGIMLGGVKQ